MHIDTKAPLVNLTATADGAAYMQRCATSAVSVVDAGSGVASEVRLLDGTIAPYDPLAANRGPHTYSIQATDALGNRTDVTRSYTV